jgi:hypothetical protein
MTIADLRALLADADDQQQVLALIENSDDSHREVAAEIDPDGDLVITVLMW